MAERARALVIAVALASLAACGGGTPDRPAAIAAEEGGAPGVLDAGAPDQRSGSTETTVDARAPDALSGAADAATSTKYEHDGVEMFTALTANVSNGTRTFTEHVYLPSSAGAHAVVSLSPGLQQPAAAYAPFAARLASYGVIVVLRDDPGPLTVTTDVEADLTYVIGTWLSQQSQDGTSALHGKVDLARIGLGGHSRGGKASLLAAERGLKGKVVAWFGLDPVDSASFSGGAQARTDVATIGIPTAYLGASVASSCSPAGDNYEVLFAASATPSVELKGIGAGHTQLEDPATCSACSLCSPSGTADSKTVLAYAVRYLVAFFARELLSDASVGAAFEGAGAAADVAAGRIQITSK